MFALRARQEFVEHEGDWDLEGIRSVYQQYLRLFVKLFACSIKCMRVFTAFANKIEKFTKT